MIRSELIEMNRRRLASRAMDKQQESREYRLPKPPDAKSFRETKYDRGDRRSAATPRAGGEVANRRVRDRDRSRARWPTPKESVEE